MDDQLPTSVSPRAPRLFPRLAVQLLFWAALAFALAMAWLPHPPALPGAPEDKLQHVAAFATLSLLAAGAFPAQPLARIGERLSFVGAIIEVVQAIPALGRDCDIRDWIADTVAIAVMLTMVGVWRSWRQGAAWVKPRG